MRVIAYSAISLITASVASSILYLFWMQRVPNFSIIFLFQGGWVVLLSLPAFFTSAFTEARSGNGISNCVFCCLAFVVLLSETLFSNDRIGLTHRAYGYLLSEEGNFTTIGFLLYASTNLLFVAALFVAYIVSRKLSSTR